MTWYLFSCPDLTSLGAGAIWVSWHCENKVLTHCLPTNWHDVATSIPVRTVYVPVPRDSVPQFSLTPSYKMCLKCIYVYTYLVPATSTPYLWNDRLLMHRHWHLVLAYLQQQAHRTSTHPCMHAHTICVTSSPKFALLVYQYQASKQATTISLFRSSALFALRAAKFGSWSQHSAQAVRTKFTLSPTFHTYVWMTMVL